MKVASSSWSLLVMIMVMVSGIQQEHNNRLLCFVYFCIFYLFNFLGQLLLVVIIKYFVI